MYLSLWWIFLKQCNPFWQYIAHGCTVQCAVLYTLLFDGEGQPLTYLNCKGAWGSWLYFRLHYKVLPAVYHAVHVWFMNNMSVYLISYRTALASHSASPHCPLPHPKKKPRYPSFSKPTEVTCSIHYYLSSDRSSNYCIYHVRVTPSVNRQRFYYSICIVPEKVGGCCGGFGGWDGCHPCLFSEAVGENEARCWSEESECVALKQSGIAVRVSHGWDVPIHSLLESCLSMQLPIRPTPGLPILIWTS